MTYGHAHRDNDNKGFRSVRTATLGLALMVGALAGCGDDAPFEPADLAGTWESPQCETGRGGDGKDFFYKRRFVMTATTWAIDFTLFADGACGTRISTAQVSGPFELLGNVDGLPGTREGNFSGSTKRVTAWVQGMADLFASSGCGAAPWSVGMAQDVGVTGCAPLGLDKIDHCPVEFDIVKLDGANLYFGDRSGGMCDAAKRTRKLQTVPVVRL